MDYTHDIRILDWLGSDEQGLAYYLYFLTLRYSHSPEALSRLHRVAKQLEQEPNYWQQVISASGWRTQLIGCYALLIAQNRNYLDALKVGLGRDPWDSPQVTVTLGLLHPSEALGYLEQWLNPSRDDAPKLTASAYQVLLKLGSSNAQYFDIQAFRDNSHPTSRYRDDSYWRTDFDIGMGVAQAHWNAWQEILTQHTEE